MNQHVRLMEIAYLLVIRLNTFEDEQEHSIDHVHNLVVLVLENHLEIKTGELSQVLVGVGFSLKMEPISTTHSISVVMAI